MAKSTTESFDSESSVNSLNFSTVSSFAVLENAFVNSTNLLVQSLCAPSQNSKLAVDCNNFLILPLSLAPGNSICSLPETASFLMLG